MAWRPGLMAVGLWSTVATAFKFSLGHLTPLELLWVATLTSWLFFAGAVLINSEWQQWADLSRRSLLAAVLTGGLNPTLYYLLLFAAYDRLPAQEAMAINYSWALTLALLAAPVLGQRIPRQQWLAAAISYLGVVVIATRGELLSLQFDDPMGVALAVASTLVWSVYWLVNTRLIMPAISGLFFNFSGGALLTTVLVLWYGLPPLNGIGIAGAAYVGLFEMGASFVLWLTAMRHSENTLRLSTLIFLSPPISLCLIWLVLGESIQAATLAGLLLILTGLGLQQWQVSGAHR